MTSYKYPLATTTWDKKEYEALQRVIESNRFTMGNEVKRFENLFSKYIGSKYSLMVNSGSSANLLMIAALFYKKENPLLPGDEIIVPAVSWSTTYYPLNQYGLIMKFVDIDLETLNYDTNKLSEAISEKTKAIMLVNLLGNPNKFNEINSIISKKDIVIIEDNCESMGAEYQNKKTGTFGIVGSFSSFFSHHISTMEGGLVVTDDQELYQIMLCIRAHGWTRDLPIENLITGRKDPNSFKESFKFVLPGYNLRPLEMSGALGCAQLEKLPELIRGRRYNAKLFQEAMLDHSDLIIQKEIGKSSWFGFSLITKKDSKMTREDLIKKLDLLGFEYRPIVTGNFTNSPVIKLLNADLSQDLTNAEYLDENGLFIGNNHFPMDEAVRELSSI